MQGWRISMEDAHTAVLDIDVPTDADAKPSPSKLAFFGVFDGHGGDKVALFTGENINNIILKQDAFKTGDYSQALKDGFLATDRAILNGMANPAYRPKLPSLPSLPYPPCHFPCPSPVRSFSRPGRTWLPNPLEAVKHSLHPHAVFFCFSWPRALSCSQIVSIY